MSAEVVIPPEAATAPPGRSDRLADLAAWWAGVCADTPVRVEAFWPVESPEPVAGQSRAVVVHHQGTMIETVAEALQVGTAAADAAADNGTDLLLVGPPPAGPGTAWDDEIAWRVLAVHLLAADPVEALGWPAADGMGDDEWIRLVSGVRDGLRAVRAIRNQPERLLETLANPGLAATTALLLRSAARRTPVLLDGPAATACAMLAYRVARPARYWWQAVDAGDHVVHDRMLTDLRLVPLTRLGLRGGDGSAGRIGLGLLVTALQRAAGGPAGAPEGDTVGG